ADGRRPLVGRDDDDLGDRDRPLGQRRLERVVRRRGEQDEPDLLDRRLRLPHRRHGDPGGVVERPAVDAGGDGGERDRTGAELVGDEQALAVAGGEHGGPTVWTTQRAPRSPAVVATAWPAGRPWTYGPARSAAQAASSSGPP